MLRGRWTLGAEEPRAHDGPMATTDATSSVPDGDPRSGRRVGLCTFAAVIALSAWGGAVGLMVGALDLGPEVTPRLPFASPVLGGIALIMVVAVPMTIVAVLAWRGDPRTGPAAVVAGVLQIWWIVVELAFIRELSFFHPLYIAVGAAFIVLGRRAPRP